MPTLVTFPADTVLVRPWADEVIDRLGHDPRSAYVERFWLGILGPSTTWFLRRVAAGFDAEPEGFELDLVETARALGLGDRNGRNSPFLRSVNRTVQFAMAMLVREGELAIRRKLPPLPLRYQERLSPALRAEHECWSAGPAGPSPDPRVRCRELAASLVELGEDVEAVERQLLRWRHHPALAREAAAWAWERHTAALSAAEARP